jgi:MerR family copper efflux transcriptional regulator
MHKMLIGEIAKQANVTPRTVRYYEKLGLLGEIEQEDNGYHYYGEQALERLRKIAVLKHLGLTLEEIQIVIEVYFIDRIQGKKKTLAILQHHLAEAEQKISALENFTLELQKNIGKVQLMIDEME